MTVFALKSKNNENINTCKLDIDPGVYLHRSVFMEVKWLCCLLSVTFGHLEGAGLHGLSCPSLLCSCPNVPMQTNLPVVKWCSDLIPTVAFWVKKHGNSSPASRASSTLNSFINLMGWFTAAFQSLCSPHHQWRKLRHNSGLQLFWDKFEELDELRALCCSVTTFMFS